MYREVRGRNAQGGMEKCTVVGWSSSCTCVTDSQTQSDLQTIKTGAAHLITVQILRQQPTHTYNASLV